MYKYFLKVLGCPKNEVDAEGINTLLKNNNFIESYDIRELDFYIILSCGFIESAKEESINETLMALSYRDINPDLKVILMGCLAERYFDELSKEIPELSGIFGLSENHRIVTHLKNILKNNKQLLIKRDKYFYRFNLKRNYFLNKSFAYLKISEGCSNKCTYCAIPHIKGNIKVRSINSLVKEISELERKGFKEIVITSQDPTSYKDKKGDFIYLLDKLLKATKNVELRLMYLHPKGIDYELLDFIKANERIIKYLDIPVQHISTKILKKMGRGYNKKYIYELFSNIRNTLPDIILRTTFIVGFPSENDKDFKELINFIKEFKIERVGIFGYSKEEDTPSFKMLQNVKQNIIDYRIDRLMQIQAKVSENFNSKRIGKIYKVMVDEIIEEDLPYRYQGRSYGEAPEIDPVVFFNSDRNLFPGDIVKVAIDDYQTYDIMGHTVI